MAIAPSRLGRFVLQQGFRWPKITSAASEEFGASDDALARRLRDAGLILTDVTDAEVKETFHAARREHVARGFSPTNSPHERVRVFLAVGPFLTVKGSMWAVPLVSLTLKGDD